MEMDKESVISKIKEKKELSGISDILILELLEKKLSKYRINLQEIKKADLKIIVKEVRAELREYSGRFKLPEKKTDILIETNNKEGLLNSHLSTRERLDFYPELKEFLSPLHISSILDLGCALNPIALSSKDIHYYASDIDQGNLDIVKRYFEKNNFPGETFIYDLRNIDFKELPKADLCIIFKVLDIIENKGHKLAEKVITKVPCKYFLVSFATKKISGKSMKFPERHWFELMLNRLGLKFETIHSSNEIFYFIKKF